MTILLEAAILVVLLILVRVSRQLLVKEYLVVDILCCETPPAGFRGFPFSEIESKVPVASTPFGSLNAAELFFRKNVALAKRNRLGHMQIHLSSVFSWSHDEATRIPSGRRAVLKSFPRVGWQAPIVEEALSEAEWEEIEREEAEENDASAAAGKESSQD